MRKLNILLGVLMAGSLSAQTNNGTSSGVNSGTNNGMNRDVTVEHEFQPVIGEAGKINVIPESLPQLELKEKSLKWSEYTTSVNTGKNFTTLGAENVRAKKEDEHHGHLTIGVGHPQTLLRFGYEKEEGKNSLAFHLHHHGEWGLKMDTKTGVGFEFGHTYSGGKFYMGVDGGHECFTYYGRYYDTEKDELTVEHYSQLGSLDKQNIWRVNAKMGVKSNGKSDFNYLVQADYKMFSRMGSVTEHQANVTANFNYAWEDHKFGLNMRSQNQFCTVSDSIQKFLEISDLHPNSRHAVRMEPFYEWKNKRIRLHVGMNLDFNVGKGYMNSGSTEDTPQDKAVAFAPSPNVQFEAELAPKFVVLYAEARGSLGTSSMAAYYGLNRYNNCAASVASHHVSTYRPVIAELGFRFRPEKNLLLTVYGGYEYNKNAAVFKMNAKPFDGTVSAIKDYAGFAKFYYCDYQEWKIGGQLDYHYRDIIEAHVWGGYSFVRDFKTFLNGAGKTDTGTATLAYDRPDWEIGTKIVGNIDKHWSVYTWMGFVGSRWAFTNVGDKKLKATIDVNLGARYQFADTKYEALNRLSVFAELKNIAHQKNVKWYGYEAEGINGLIGASWSF